ncbi:MAG: hypothetical protein KatS3mg099_376 [Candidatus Parcubacteria bacterium]|nr:MAG: hypothetical protein KatS3mg099_376 [Candidatus Parcubacteria bacterium]
MERQWVEDPEGVVLIGETTARGGGTRFGIKAKDRARHMYVIGKTGMGKSTLLENLAIQDIRRGAGVTFVDPHGASAERLLDYIPPERVRDVIYFAPFDLAHPIAFNVLEKVDPDKRHLIVSSLMATFEKIWVDAWSARMAYILQNTLSALLEYPGATLLGVNRMYVDSEFRKHVVEHITDPAVKSFWKDEYTKYTDRYAAEATPAIQNKIGQFASNAMIRNIVGQEHTSFDLRRAMDERKILIVNLSKGRIGEDNARLLGAMLVTKLYLAAMSRADTSPEELAALPPHYLYVDEFQSFANRTFADILSEARKFKLALTIAHQYIEQMEEEIRAAVFGNVGTMITFRVGAYDAEILEREFGPKITAQDLVNLGFAEIYIRLMVDGITLQPFSAQTLPPFPRPQESYRAMALAASRAQWSRDRKAVEEEVLRWHAPVVSEATQLKRERKELRRQQRASGNQQNGAAQGKDAPTIAQTGSASQPSTERKRQEQPRDNLDREEPSGAQAQASAPRDERSASSRQLGDILAAVLAQEAQKGKEPNDRATGADEEQQKEAKVEGETLRELLMRLHRIESKLGQAIPTRKQGGKQGGGKGEQGGQAPQGGAPQARPPVGIPPQDLQRLLAVEEDAASERDAKSYAGNKRGEKEAS